MQLTKTALGQSAFKERSPLFSARQRSIFILFDGKKSAEQVLAATAGMGSTQADIDHMLEHGFLVLADPDVAPMTVAGGLSIDVEPAPQAPASNRTPQERYLEAYPVAVRLTGALGLRGFRLNLSVEAAGNYEELLALLPKIRDAVGTKASLELEQALKG